MFPRRGKGQARHRAQGRALGTRLPRGGHPYRGHRGKRPDTRRLFPPCQRHAGQHPRRPARNLRPVQRAARPFRRFAEGGDGHGFRRRNGHVGGRVRGQRPRLPARFRGREGTAPQGAPALRPHRQSPRRVGQRRSARGLPRQPRHPRRRGGCGNAHRLAGHPRQHGPRTGGAVLGRGPRRRRRARRLRQAGHRRFQYLRRHRSGHRRYPRTRQRPRGAGQRRGHPRHPALDRLVRRARGENGISLPPEGFPHSFHTPPRTGFGTRRQFGRIALRAFRPPAAPFRDRHRSRGACGFA